LFAQAEFPEHLQPLKQSLETRDFESYLSLCTPEIRERENIALQSYFQTARMESLNLFFAGESKDAGGSTRAFFQVIFQNEYSAIIEIWQITYEEVPAGGLKIIDRRISSSLSNLYRLSFPGERSIFARNVSLTQKDIRITFPEASIFFDNLPDVDTAVIIVGSGQIHFQPSDEIERNQLLRVYKKPFFEERLEYVYVRAGKYFFQDNLSYEPIEGAPAATPAEVMNNQAYSIFSRNYHRSFTVENSLTRELLTFLPQSGETVIEIKTAKRGEFTYVFSPFAEEEVSFFDRTHNKLINSYCPAEEEPGQKRLFVRLGERYDVDQYQLEVSYRPENKLLAARATINLISLIDNIDSLQFRLNPALEILSIRDDKGRQLYYTQDRLRKLIYIYLAEKSGRDSLFRIHIYYRGRIVPPPPITDSASPQNPEGRRVVFSVPEDTYLFTQSADWYPAPVREKYYAFRLRLIVPQDYYCLAGGRLVERYSVNEAGNVTELENLGNSVFVYESEAPVKYIGFFIGKLKFGSKITNEVDLEYFFTDDWRSPEKDMLKDTASILEAYERYFGQFPFPGLSIVHRYWKTRGGHSQPGFIVLNEMIIATDPGVIMLNPRSPVDLSYWKEYYLAHEIAHQWWGHGVSWATYRDNWLAEGMAQFSSLLYLQEKYGQKELEKMLKRLSAWVRKKSEVGPITLGVRLSHTNYEAYQAVVYNKSALALFMLKDLLGDKVFFRGLQELFQSHLFKAARTSDFRRAMEKVSGKDLARFFHDWFNSDDLPDVKFEKKVIHGSDSNALNIRVRQLKRAFIFPLEVIVETDRGSSAHILVVERDDQNFNLGFSGQLKNVRINPGNKVPGKFK